MLLSFAVVFGMRYDVGEDHLGYLDGYINPFLHKEYEPLFALIRDTLSNAGVHPIVFFAVCAFIQVFCLFYFMKDCKFLYPALIVSLFMGQFFIHWMNGIRQDIAGCIFLCAITCVIDKRIVGFFTLVPDRRDSGSAVSPRHSPHAARFQDKACRAVRKSTRTPPPPRYSPAP